MPWYFIALISSAPFLLLFALLFWSKWNESKEKKQPNEKVEPYLPELTKAKITPLFYSEDMLKSREHIRYLIKNCKDELLQQEWNKAEHLILSIESDDEYVEKGEKHRLNETLLQDVLKLLNVYFSMEENRRKQKHTETKQVIIHITSILQEIKDGVENKKEDEYNRLHEIIHVRES